MDNLISNLNNLIGKDEIKAQQAASYLINNSDVELFQKLVEKTDFLFDFVRNNVLARLDKAINKNNFCNIINLFKIYSPYYDDFFVSILSKHANQDLTDTILELLEKGTVAEKTYASKYFYYIPDTVALEILNKYAFCEDEYLSYNSAEALGQMQDDISFDIALSYLKSSDDFERLKAVKFFCAYGRNYPLKDIFDAMKSSKMPENIAGQIPYMQSILDLLDIDETKEDALYTVDYILSGLGEILPISDIFQFELFEVIEFLINVNKQENNLSGKISEILLKALSKFKLFNENNEYIFDEDKNTKYEVNAIFKLLKGQSNEFWNLQKDFIIDELNQNNNRILSVLPVIVEFNITDSIIEIRRILKNSTNEIILCEALSALKNLGSILEEDFNVVYSKVKNPNIKAIIDNLKN